MSQPVNNFKKYKFIIFGVLILTGVVGSRLVEDPYKTVFLGFAAGIALVQAGEMFVKARAGGKN